MLSSLQTFFQHILPHHILTHFLGNLANCKQHYLKNLAIRSFIRAYKVNMQEALKENPEDYASFNEFFTRPLKSDVRPFPKDLSAILSPADGSISQCGQIDQYRL